MTRPVSGLFVSRSQVRQWVTPDRQAEYVHNDLECPVSLHNRIAQGSYTGQATGLGSALSAASDGADNHQHCNKSIIKIQKTLKFFLESKRKQSVGNSVSHHCFLVTSLETMTSLDFPRPLRHDCGKNLEHLSSMERFRIISSALDSLLQPGNIRVGGSDYS
ncbi:hypothetical protein RRG08_064490 [Elysia crispata]|uniref:Uncharacterized protein n=1 Tax=Elysia crispata TaxID=231223 RepID=A0AAE1AFC8_9GAST|nr:hypothetical protein RRG08_064490 [Elysia crispata]